MTRTMSSQQFENLAQESELRSAFFAKILTITTEHL